MQNEQDQSTCNVSSASGQVAFIDDGRMGKAQRNLGPEDPAYRKRDNCSVHFSWSKTIALLHSAEPGLEIAFF